MKKRRSKVKRRPKPEGYELPIDRREPVDDPWQYAYLITGHKKIGKTSFAIEGCEEFIIQFDKPQISYNVREVCPDSWGHFMKVLKALERRAASGDFPYERIIIDGVGEWYSMCQTAVCEHFGVEHPQDVGYAKAWHKLRDDFTDAVNRLLRLQITANCGLMFIAHAEWKEVNTRSSGKMERMVPSLPGRCEEIVGGKVDGWFVYDYVGENRILVVQGDETTGAGHRIDGRFLTPDDRAVKEIFMGKSSADAMNNFLAAFRNEQSYITYKEMRTGDSTGGKKRKRKVRRSK